ncbi:MAG: heme-binding protein [Vicinamibacterales bacterium]
MWSAIAVRVVVAVVVVLSATPALAQLPNPYGAPLSLENAKKIAAAAVAEARKNNWNVAIAIVDPAGALVYFEKLDGTQNASVTVAIEKARTSAQFKRATKAFQDVVAAGGDGLRILSLPGAVPVEGGVPALIDGRIVGAVGVSGATSAQDGQVAAAGVAAVK